MFFQKCTLFVFVLLPLFSCNKNDDNQSPPSPTQPTITSNAILIVTFERTQGTDTYTSYLNCFNSDKSIRWKKKLPGTSTGVYTSYSKGIVYVGQGYFAWVGAPGGAYTSYGNCLAIDINNGNDVWKITNSPTHFETATTFNDTLLCVTGQVTYSLSKINPKTGVIYGRYPISEQYGIANLIVDGNTLYYVGVSSFTNSNLNAFDLQTSKRKWQRALGINIQNGFSKIEMDDQRLYIKNGTGSLLAINKVDGGIVWQKSGTNNQDVLYSNNLVFSADDHEGLFAYSAQSGDLKWQWKRNGFWWLAGHPYAYGKNIFFTGTDPQRFFISLKADTGEENWNVDPKGVLQDPIVIGKEIYAMKDAFMNSAPISKIIILESQTGIIKDSILLNGESHGKVGILTSEDKLVYPN